MIEAYPLQWPLGYERSKFPERSRFGNRSLDYSTKAVLAEIGRMGGTNPIISTNIPLRKDGLPRSDYARRSISDRGVAVYFTYKKSQVVLACDRWDTIEDNLWAVSLSIEAMRGLSRWGVSEILERTFTGFQALPEPDRKSCWEVLELLPTKDKEFITRKYRELSRSRHPDAGGTHELFVQLQKAYEEALTYATQPN